MACGKWVHIMNNECSHKRDSSMELLRIISMFFIVLAHYGHSGIYFDSLPTFERIMHYMQSAGNLGVDIFVILSGYYMVNSYLKLKKLLLLEALVLFYTIGFYVIFFMRGTAEVSLDQIGAAFAPTIFEHYWFFTPYINKFIHSLSKAAFIKFILIMVLLWCVSTTVFSRGLYNFPLGAFLLLYSIGAYFRLYPWFKYNTKKCSLIIIAVCVLFLFAYQVIAGALAIGRYGHFSQRLSLPTLMLAIGIFMMFTHIKLKRNRFINLIALSTFGIYLIHENTYVRATLWTFLQTVRGDIPHIVYALLCAIAVFAACSVIELLRSRTVGVLADKLITKFLLKLKCISISVKNFITYIDGKK